MAFGMKSPVANDFAERVKIDARSGRMIKITYNPDSGEKEQEDITYPPPKFAFDFGSLEIGYAHFSPMGPDFRVVPEGQKLPDQPTDKDEKGKLTVPSSVPRETIWPNSRRAEGIIKFGKRGLGSSR